jgi:hypothetical protein
MPDTAILTEQEAQQVRTKQTSQGLVRLNDVDIAVTKQTIEQAEKLVATVLEPEIDYGLHPGTNSMAVKDSGAAKIANAFNTYPEHAILHITEQDDLISYLIQARLIHRGSGAVVGSGVGACSTMESKYAYRWVRDPEEYGFDKKTLRYDKERKKYRITNPEIEDLGNTILKMASKRAELDAANSLPGVASGLKKLFQGKTREEPRWTTFWSEVNALGLDEESVHNLLGVKTMKDWLGSGKSLNQAVELLAKKVKDLPRKEGEGKKEAKEGEEKGEGKEEEIPQVDDDVLKGWQIARGAIQKLEITDKQIRNWFAHYKVEIGLADFAKALPREDITKDIISNFVAMLDAFKEKKAAEKSKDNILD